MNNQASAPNDYRETGQLIPAPRGVLATREPYGSLAGYDASVVDESEQFSRKLLEYWRILYRRKWLILSVVAAFVTLGAVRALMQTPVYTSTVRLQIDRAGLKVVEGGGDVVASDDYAFMQTQFELLKSRAMAERVVSLLKLGNDAVGRVMGGMTLQQVALSRLLDISYTDLDPVQAQRIANGYADAFMASNIDKRFQANEFAKIFLEDKIKQLKQRLEASEGALVAFAEKEQIVQAQEKQSTAEANLASASAELQTLISERTKNEELWRQAENVDEINLPQLLSSSVINGLRNKRNELDLQYQEKLQIYKPGFPAMVQIHKQIQEIDRQLATEVSTIKAALKATYESTLAQEKATASRVGELKSAVLDLQKRSIQYNILKREVDTNRELYTSLLQRYKEVDVASGVGTNNVFVIDRAMPGDSSSRGLMSGVVKSAALGLALGFALAYLLEMLDNKLRTIEQVEQITGLPVLGLIPEFDKVENELADPRSVLCEAYRSLCTSLQFATADGLPKTLTITSAGPGEGKSLTSLAIARHFSILGRKVLLVDADLRNPSLHIKLRNENSVGLSTYLTGACTPPQALQKTDISNLAFIASGPLPPNAADLLGSARLISLLSRGLEVFDLIVIDGPPVLGLADALLLSSASAGTIFVVGAGATRTTLVRGALKRLQFSRGSIIGTVLTKYNAKAAGHDYGYGYGYGQDYGADANPRGLSVRSHGPVDKQLPQLTDGSA